MLYTEGLDQLCHHGASEVLRQLARKLNADLTFTTFDSAICLEDDTDNPSLLHGSC